MATVISNGAAILRANAACAAGVGIQRPCRPLRMNYLSSSKSLTGLQSKVHLNGALRCTSVTCASMEYLDGSGDVTSPGTSVASLEAPGDLGISGLDTGISTQTENVAEQVTDASNVGVVEAVTGKEPEAASPIDTVLDTCGVGGDGPSSGGDGGGDDDNDGDDGKEEGDGVNRVPKVLSMSQKLTLVYAALVGVGGLMGFLKSGSIKSLISGGAAASALFYVYTQLPSNAVQASYVGVGVSSLLLSVMGWRFMKSGKVFPAGIVSLVSLVMTGGYVHGIMRSSHA